MRWAGAEGVEEGWLSRARHASWGSPRMQVPELCQEGQCRAAPLPSIRQMSGQVSGGSAGEYQADEQAGVVRLSWRVSGK